MKDNKRLKSNVWRILKSKNKHEIRTCNFHNAQECPYNSVSDCNFNKIKCHLNTYKKKNKKSNVIDLRLIIFILFGLLIYIITWRLKSTNTFLHSNFIYNLGISVSLSIIAGSILAIVIDLPSKLKDYEESFINALSSNHYLKSLDEIKLSNLRNEITEQLHKKDIPSMARGLIDLDGKICDLLKQPYYSRYRHTIICSNIEGEEKYFMKQNTVDYKLINPYSVNRQAKEFITLKSLMWLEDEASQQEVINKLDFKIYCSIDNEEKQDLSNKVKCIFQDVDSSSEYYNKRLVIVGIEETDTSNGYRIDFEDNIEVSLQYNVNVLKSDTCFTKRLKHPAKNFRLDFSHKDTCVKLQGQIFGTEIKQSDVQIKYIADNSISLETFGWLLRYNGAIVVIGKKDLNNNIEAPIKNNIVSL